MRKNILSVLAATLTFITPITQVWAQQIPTTTIQRVSADIISIHGADPALTYTLQFTTDLNSNWVNIATIPGSMPTYTNVNPPGLQGFYHVRCIPGVFVTLDSASPLPGLIQISTAAQTQNVPLLVVDVKPVMATGSFENITYDVHSTRVSPSSLFTQFSLKVGGSSFGAQSVTQVSSNEVLVNFSNFGLVTLPNNTLVPMTLFATVQQDTAGSLDGATVIASLVTSDVTGAGNPIVLDQNYNNLPVNVTTIAGSTLTFSGQQVLLSNTSSSVGSAIVSNNTVVGYNVSYTFAITAGNQTAYVSADPSIFLSTSTSSGTVLQLSPSGISANPGQVSGDLNVNTTSGYYVIPAGTSRQFTLSGTASIPSGIGLHNANITAIHYGTTTSALSSQTIDYNLTALTLNF